MPISTPPLDYKLDREGTSGISVGPELTILDGAERQAPPHTIGRISVRGSPVFEGYLKPDGTLDKSAFNADGWFDTGDLGYMDEDGFLYITGRSKEVINRGGEIISPFEVENAIVSAAADPDSPISPISIGSKDAEAGVQRATSVNLVRQHARHISAGSAKLLEISPRNSVDQKRRMDI